MPWFPKDRKAAYVRRQRQTRDHHCHWPGCGKQVPPAMWGCRKHWFMLPKLLRDRIWEEYRPGQEVNWTPSLEYVRVAQEVQEWIKINWGGWNCIVCQDTGSTESDPAKCFNCGKVSVHVEAARNPERVEL